MPRLSRVPHAPAALLGLANLRGTVLPILSLGALIDTKVGAARRIIVVNAGEPVGLAVDDVSDLADTGGVREIDVAQLIAKATPPKAERRSHASGVDLAETASIAEESIAFLGFAVAGQEFALPLSVIDEARALPDDVTLMPHADAVVIGSAAVRGAILPLLSARALLGFPAAAVDASSRVLVVRVGQHRIGLVADALRTVLHIPESAIDPVPHALARSGAEARIQAICRLDGGKRLVSVLAADQLMREDITARLLQGNAEERDMVQVDVSVAEEQFLLFRIGDEEFGLPVAAVEEVAPLPSKLTRLPKAPTFVKGVVNLRGEVIPVIDQAQRFGSSATGGGRPRIVVVRIDDLRAGFVVDEVSAVARFGAAALRAAPDLGSEGTQVFERIANLPDEQRIVLIVSPRELLSRAERDLLRDLGEKGAAKKP